MKRYLGVDLHRTQFVVCTRLENGQHEVRQWRMGQLQEFVEQLQREDEIAVEAMGTTARFHEAVVDRVARVVVVNPHQFKVISESSRFPIGESDRIVFTNRNSDKHTRIGPKISKSRREAGNSTKQSLRRKNLGRWIRQITANRVQKLSHRPTTRNKQTRPQRRPS